MSAITNVTVSPKGWEVRLECDCRQNVPVVRIVPPDENPYTVEDSMRRAHNKWWHETPQRRADDVRRLEPLAANVGGVS